MTHVEEVARRLAQLDAGEVECIPWAEVRERLREKHRVKAEEGTRHNMRHRIIEQDGETLLKIETPDWRAELVLSLGANLTRLTHLASGLDILRFPPSMAELREKPEVWGIPALFPPNRIDAGRFAMDGRSYAFPVNDVERGNHMHGFLSRRPWELGTARESSVTALFRHGPERDSFAYFPHKFRFELSYEFAPNLVTQRAKVVNLGPEPMPFGLGFHTAFRLPFGPATPEALAQCNVKVAMERRSWEVSDRILPTGASLPLPPDQDWPGEGVNPSGKAISLHAPAAAGRSAILESPADRARVVYTVDDAFGHWMLWNHGGGKAFFCPEPMTWMVDAPNLKLPPAVTGLRSLGPGGGRTLVSSIGVSTKA